MAAYSKWAHTEDRTTATAPARAAARTALNARLCEQFNIEDPSTEGGRRRLEAARKAHYANLALKGAEARRRKGGAR